MNEWRITLIGKPIAIKGTEDIYCKAPPPLFSAHLILFPHQLPERGKNGRFLSKYSQLFGAVQQQQPTKVPTVAAVTVAPTEDTVAPAARIDAQGDEEKMPLLIKEENVEG